MQLEQYGWSDFFAERFAAHTADGLEPARVSVEHRGGYRVHSLHGELAAEVSGRFRHEAISSGDFPAVGDWVVVQAYPEEDKAVITAVLERKTKFSRTAAGDSGEEQVLAANIDEVFVVAALGGDLSLRRVERYLTLAWQSGADPVVLLTKADLCDDVAGKVREVRSVAHSVPLATPRTHRRFARSVRRGEIHFNQLFERSRGCCRSAGS